MRCLCLSSLPPPEGIDLCFAMLHPFPLDLAIPFWSRSCFLFSPPSLSSMLSVHPLGLFVLSNLPSRRGNLAYHLLTTLQFIGPILHPAPGTRKDVVKYLCCCFCVVVVISVVCCVFCVSFLFFCSFVGLFLFFCCSFSFV
jgi:hypothetical protein